MDINISDWECCGTLEGSLFFPKITSTPESNHYPTTEETSSLCYSPRTREFYLFGGKKNLRVGKNLTERQRRRKRMINFLKNKQGTKQIWVFDLDEKKWNLHSMKLPEGRFGSETFFLEEKNIFLCFGGRKDSFRTFFDDGDYSVGYQTRPEIMSYKLFAIVDPKNLNSYFESIKLSEIEISKTGSTVIGTNNCMIITGREKKIFFHQNKGFNRNTYIPIEIVDLMIIFVDLSTFSITKKSKPFKKQKMQSSRLLSYHCIHDGYIFGIISNESRYDFFAKLSRKKENRDIESPSSSFECLNLMTMKWEVLTPDISFIEKNSKSRMKLIGLREIILFLLVESNREVKDDLIVFSRRSKTWKYYSLSFGELISSKYLTNSVITDDRYLCFCGGKKQDGKNKNEVVMDYFGVIVRFDLKMCLFGDLEIEDFKERTNYLFSSWNDDEEEEGIEVLKIHFFGGLIISTLKIFLL